MENFTDQEIAAHLRANPDLMYITPDGHNMYVYVPVKDGVLCITSVDDLNEATYDQKNQFLQECLRAVMGI